MYNQLFAAWQREIDDPTLGALSPDFYVKISEYLRRIKDENKILDKKSVKMNLLLHESSNVERMLKELLETRYRKLIKNVTKNQKTPVELLTNEETLMVKTFADFTKIYHKFADDLMLGQITQIAEPDKAPIRVVVKTENASLPVSKRSTIRFLKSIPAIMGADMKSYGPFIAEDVASLPPQNAQILVKQGLAVIVEVS
jgi:DNA replication factor GINS